MNFMFITQVWPRTENETNMYSDLVEEISAGGHSVTVLLISEKRNMEPTCLRTERGIRILRVRCGNIQKTNKYRKVISSVLAGPALVRACGKYLAGERFDGIIWALSTMLIEASVMKLKRRFGARLYLLLKEYWPQDPADLGAMSKNGLLYKAFLHIEKRMLTGSDLIGTCSEAGIAYVRERISIPDGKISVCPNSEKSREYEADLPSVRESMGVPEGKVLFIFGGNLGLSQGVDDMIPEIKAAAETENTFFLILGSGTEYEKAARSLNGAGDNIKVCPSVPQHEFFRLCCEADVGMMFLFRGYTVPNIPGKFTTYLNAGLPVLAAVDGATDVGKIIGENECGLSCAQGDVTAFKELVRRLAEDKALREKMSRNSKRLFEEKYTAASAAGTIIRSFAGDAD